MSSFSRSITRSPASFARRRRALITAGMVPEPGRDMPIDVYKRQARMVRSLGGDTYVDGLYTEVHQYAADLCLEYGLDTAVALSLIHILSKCQKNRF